MEPYVSLLSQNLVRNGWDPLRLVFVPIYHGRSSVFPEGFLRNPGLSNGVPLPLFRENHTTKLGVMDLGGKRRKGALKG